ncbi:hypothetical protein Scep_001987 [Stephania cephalantha]|uniref:Uncharacterized protein n=1 Tax=Stephania cephalantha TaxID=152367 RepID=A0AAP0Q8B7_9MAGN
MRPDFVTNKTWKKYCECWASADFKAKSEKASQNRKSKKDGRGTGYSKPLALEKDDDITPNDVLFHVHMKDHDGVTFINNRSALFHVSLELMRRPEEHTQATLDQPIDEEQLYYDTVRDCPKHHVYGLGSHGRRRRRRYADLGVSMSR